MFSSFFSSFRVFSTYVSSHYTVPSSDISAYMVRKNLSYSETLHHFIIRQCPFCPPPVHPGPSDLNKLYVQKHRGVFLCHRCGTKGGWFEFKRMMGDLDVGNGTVGLNVNTLGRMHSKVRIKVEKGKEEEKRNEKSSVDVEEMREAVRLLESSSECKEYLKKRGLDESIIRKYGVGAMRAKFLGDDDRYEEHLCITFPFISKIQQTARVGRKKKVPAALLSLPLMQESEPIIAAEEQSVSIAKEPLKVKLNDTLSTSEACPFDANVAERYTTHRVKLRSINRKKNQRFFPSGIRQGWFGLHTIPADASTIVITEGEFDAMAVHQETGLPAISLPNGASSLPIELLPDLERFQKIILWMDDDVAGQQGAEKVAKKVGSGRCVIIRSKSGQMDGPKDANEALLKGANFMQIIQDGDSFPHSNILDFADLKKEIYAELLEPVKLRGVQSITIPTYNSILKGHRKGELTVLTGGTGTGKTTLLSQLSLDFCKQGVRTLWGSFEIKNTRLAKLMLSQFANKNLESSISEFEKYASAFSELPLLFLRFQGSSLVDEVVDAMDYAVYANDVEHVVLDNLQFMLSGQARGFDKFDHQEHAIEVFRRFATQRNVHITLVIHPRKEAEGSLLGVGSVFGSAKATQEADNVLILQDTAIGRVLEIKKNRFDGQLGSIYLRFDSASRLFIEQNPEEISQLEKKTRDTSKLDTKKRL